MSITRRKFRGLKIQIIEIFCVFTVLFAWLMIFNGITTKTDTESWIEVKSPGFDNRTIERGKTFNITWNYSGDISYVSIILLNKRRIEKELFHNITNNGEYIWKVNETETQDQGYRIIIRVIGYPVEAKTKDDFPIGAVERPPRETTTPIAGFEVICLVLGLIACVFLLYRCKKLKILVGDFE
ncbi:MAG: Ser-Thr-rich GPI-anchored membrane family protein [Candidatus Hermodarchaeota archaeon]